MITEYKGRYFTPAPGLRSVRERLGISQTELARISGVSRNQIMRIEHGDNTTLKSLDRLAEALVVDRDVLLSGSLPERTAVSRFEVGEEGAGEIENDYIDHLVGGEVADPYYEQSIANDYLRIWKLEGSTDEAFKLAILRALRIGKARGEALA